MSFKNDQRLKQLKEILNSIKVLKMYVWELKFSQILQEIRKLELKNSFLMMFWYYIGESLNQTQLFISMVIQIAFLLFMGQENTINTANILSTLDLLTFVQLLLAVGYKGMLGQSEMQNVLLKFYQIYNVEEKVDKINKNNKNQQIMLDLDNFTGFYISNNKKNPVLKNINFQANKDQLITILGSVSSGKTSFLNIFMNEIPYYDGNIGVYGNIAYVETEPYIFVGTVRDNVVLDAVYNHEWYEKVLEKCCILEDICKLKNQDQTMVGDNSGGVQLSGGQKARISLARAVYQKKDIYLLDDPLSAVDVNIAKKLLKNVIKDLLKDKTVILATHQMDMIQDYTDKVIYLQDKTILKQGSYQEVKQFLQKNNLLQKIKEEIPQNANYNSQQVNQQQQEISADDVLELSVNIKNPLDTSLEQNLEREQEHKYKQNQEINKNQNSSQLLNSNKKQNKSQNTSIYNSTHEQETKESQKSLQIIQNSNYDCEEQNKDQINEDYVFTQTQNKKFIKKFSLISQKQQNVISDQKLNLFNQKIGLQVYKNYFKILGPYIITLLAILHFFFDYYIFLQIFELFGQYQNKDQEEKYQLTLQITIYTTIYLVSQILRFLNWCQIHLRGMYKLHTQMITKIAKSTCQYFDQTPIGSILTKFSNDLGVCDIQLFQFIVEFTDKWLQTLVLMGYICYSNLYLTFIMIFQLFFIFLFYNKSKKMLSQSRFIDLQNKDPIFSLLYNTISGIQNLKVYGLIPSQINKLQKLINNSQRCSYSFWLLQRAFVLLSQYINTIFGITTLFIMIFSTMKKIQNESSIQNKDVLIQNLGIVIVYILKMQELVPRAIRQTSNMDVSFNSFNRINQYLDQIPQEKENKSVEKNEFQILNGDITFKNVALQYDPKSKPVLKDLSINIKQGEKIAIVGRSGAGKSTVFQALFRMKEIEDFENQSKGIFIDQQRIQNFSQQQVRNSISIIPQTPYLYTGSIKFNLDPYNKCNDDKIKLLLAELKLSDYLQQLRIDLNTQITQETSLFSIGQKQLICLGRAILQQNKILVVDEATANCDKQTDEQIQELIKQKFKDCTVLTIAHRLETIADSDKILVLDYGIQQDYDHPHNLLQQNDTNIFQQMVDQMEPKQKKNIYKIAQKAFYKQQQIK